MKFGPFGRVSPWKIFAPSPSEKKKLPFSTFLPNWPPVDGRPYDRSTLFDILDQERPDRLPDAAFVAAREHLAKGEWTAAAVVLNDLTGLLDFLSRRFEDEVPT